MTETFRKVQSNTDVSLKRIAQRFDIHLRLAREMHRDGNLRSAAQPPEYENWELSPRPFWERLLHMNDYYGLCEKKFFRIYQAGHLRVFGLDLQEATRRYMQRNGGNLSVRLLSHLAYEEMRAVELRIKNEAAMAVFARLKIDGELQVPTYLAPYLDAASKRHHEPLEHVARWMRDLLECSECPRSWAFFGVRLALVEGFYGPRDYPIPKLRKWSQRQKLRGLLRAHPLLQGCVSRVSAPGWPEDKFAYRFHSPKPLYDL